MLAGGDEEGGGMNKEILGLLNQIGSGVFAIACGYYMMRGQIDEAIVCVLLAILTEIWSQRYKEESPK